MNNQWHELKSYEIAVRKTEYGVEAVLINKDGTYDMETLCDVDMRQDQKFLDAVNSALGTNYHADIEKFRFRIFDKWGNVAIVWNTGVLSVAPLYADSTWSQDDIMDVLDPYSQEFLDDVNAAFGTKYKMEDWS